ncbi:hypothetical protein PISL3812_06649 [Talaromyces islandicus]|uniref:Cyclochlorotine biosynthesis protein O n=1 Tax=Talaromyces islandicus TaxID=28573 RepID=A0A0U1M3L1_TALIS|nr:hypothetical protein PISL3812_06649 [Talaromyces islandicus]
MTSKDKVKYQKVLDREVCQSFSSSDSMSDLYDDAVKPSLYNRVFSSRTYVIANYCFIFFNLWFVLVSWNRRITLRSYCPEIPFAPFQHEIQYEKRALDLVSPNPYAGPRTPEMDKAWENLKFYEIWRATKEELELSGAYEDRSLRLEHGGYMAIMRVYHELHCLLNQDWIKREWDPKYEHMVWHLDHCLDALVQGAMCKADLSVGSFYWWPEDKEEREKVRRPDYKRECVNWDGLNDLLHERRMMFLNGVPEAPLDGHGKPVVVPPTDGLHNHNSEIAGGQ